MTAETSYLEQVRRLLAGYRPRRIEAAGRPLAGVLLLLYDDTHGETHLLFTKRTELVEYHKGEICFPGGRREAGDEDLFATAVRETFEEVGIPPEHVERIGELDDIVSRGSNFVISPFVGFLTASAPYHYSHARHEVDEILEIPLAHLLDDTNGGLELRRIGDEDVETPFYRFHEHVIWGATARILAQFLGLISAGAVSA
jgi:8-oxo-dGTP pyrophosphatase MutT (NUDIX family)